MNARETNRPGGRGRRRPNVRTGRGAGGGGGGDTGGGGGGGFVWDVIKPKGCAVLVLALAAVPVTVLADVIWRRFG